jgi:hypothetical protein
MQRISTAKDVGRGHEFLAGDSNTATYSNTTPQTIAQPSINSTISPKFSLEKFKKS